MLQRERGREARKKRDTASRECPWCLPSLRGRWQWDGNLCAGRFPVLNRMWEQGTPFPWSVLLPCFGEQHCREDEDEGEDEGAVQVPSL